MIDIVDDVFVEVFLEGESLLLVCYVFQCVALLDDWRVDQDFGNCFVTGLCSLANQSLSLKVKVDLVRPSEGSSWDIDVRVCRQVFFENINLTISLLCSLKLILLLLPSQFPCNDPSLLILDHLLRWEKITRPRFGILFPLQLRFLVCSQPVGGVLLPALKDGLPEIFDIVLLIVVLVVLLRHIHQVFGLKGIVLAQVEPCSELVRQNYIFAFLKHSEQIAILYLELPHLLVKVLLLHGHLGRASLSLSQRCSSNLDFRLTE